MSSRLHVIVHKTDRLARNTRDDYESTTVIAAVGAELISVSERFDNTLSGNSTATSRSASPSSTSTTSAWR